MKKRISLLILIICMVGGIVFFFPKKNTQEVKMVKKKQTPEISFYHQEYKERYDTYQKAHQDLSKKEVITLVNMNRDFDFYGKIIKQEHPNDLNTIVNKYYQLDETYEPSDLVEINTNAGTYGSSYSKHTARKVVYDDFQALKQACINKGFELYVTSGYRSTVWQKEIYNHMVETYSVERADETCSRPGHSEHTTGLGLDIALDQYKYEEVENELNNINHVSTSYNSLLIMFANELENLIGKERLSDYREKNDFSVIKEFNDIVKNSEIAKKYIGTTDAFEYFSSKCYELFDLSLHKYQMDIDKYKLESYKIMVDVFAPICAYKEVKYGTSNLEKYENSREEYLGTEEKQYKTK